MKRTKADVMKDFVKVIDNLARASARTTIALRRAEEDICEYRVVLLNIDKRK